MLNYLVWLISQPQKNAIVGAREREQAAENAKAGEVKLSEEELKEMEAIGRTVTDPLDDNPVMWNF
ncbi:aldo/keto reductase [Microcoleus sp. S13_B4]|uniref:aldo/keto reductase n=1 Tax=Microcoleus sp. S13_B4 TaxID=3055408 RepID=UPI002FD419B1